MYFSHTRAVVCVRVRARVCMYVCIIIKFLIVGEREMPNFAFFTAENDVNMYTYIFVILYHDKDSS